MSKLSNLMKLKGGWYIEEYDVDKGWIKCYNDKWNLTKKIKIPPIFLEVLKFEKLNEVDNFKRKFRNLLGL